MAVGIVSANILTDIDNAIRYKVGVATLYKPREMAAAVSALDDTDAGNCQAQPYMALESGVLPESVFSDIAAAIRGQNGESALYAPGDMAAAILALKWDVGYKIRALLSHANNTLLSVPDSLHSYECLKELEFFVYMDFFMTPTAELADIVLPAALWPGTES